MTLPRRDVPMRRAAAERRGPKEEWKYQTQVALDQLEFPAGVKPAALIIGVQGANHARLQSGSGCCVQLRGSGVSFSPPDEPLHILVKYDDPQQLRRFHEILSQIIYEAKQRSVSAPVRFTSPPQTPLECFYSIHQLLYAVKDVTTKNLLTKYHEHFGWPVDSRFSQLGMGSIARSLSMLLPLLALTNVHTGQRLLRGQLADPVAEYTVTPLQPRDLTFPELKAIMDQYRVAQAPPAHALVPAAHSPVAHAPAAHAPVAPAAAAAPPPAATPPPRVLKPPTAPPPPPKPEDILIDGLHALVKEVKGNPAGVPLNKACEELTRRTGIVVNAPALGYKNVVEYAARTTPTYHPCSMVSRRCAAEVLELWQNRDGTVMVRLGPRG